MHMIFESLVLATALTTAAIAAPPAQQPLMRVFDQMGGERIPMPDEARNIPGLPPLLWPLRDFPRQVMGSRYFSERRLTDGTATAERARELFAEQCEAAGGRIEPAGSNAAIAFERWATEDRLPATQEYKHRWRAITSLCAHGTEKFLGGFYAAIFDATGVASKGDIGSRAMMRLFPTKTLTAAYIFRGEGLGPQAQNAKSHAQLAAERLRISRAQDEKRTAELQALENKLTAELRANVQVGSETNCGTVIEVRPPLVQIALPVTTLGPYGQTSFWSRIDRISPKGANSSCSFGL